MKHKDERNYRSLHFVVFCLIVLLVVIASFLIKSVINKNNSETLSNCKTAENISKDDSIERSEDVQKNNSEANDKQYEALEELVISELKPKIFNDDWVYENEVMGLLSLGSFEEIKKIQKGKLDALPSEIAKDVVGCEGIWYLGAATDIINLGMEVPQDRIDKMYVIARATFEVLYEEDITDATAIEGLAACYLREGDYEKCLSILQSQASMEGENETSQIKNQIALARVLRLVGGSENEQEAEAIYNELLDRKLKTNTYDAIKSELDNPETVPNQNLFEVSGVSFSSLVNGHGVVRHMEGFYRERLETVLSSPLPDNSSYDPDWLVTMPIVMPVYRLAGNVFKTRGFSRDPQVRLYYASVLYRVSPSNPMATVGLAQSLQENN